MKLYILMSTYNGSSYIREQINSIQSQSYTDWHLLVRDDGSIDNTRDIIEEYCRDDKRILPCHDSLGNIGPTHSFSALADLALTQDADYIMFSDQDDIWNEWKIEESLTQIKAAEDASPGETPVLLHTDLEVVDANLNLISRSYLEYQNISHTDESALSVLLSQNFVTGCTIIANKALLTIAQPIPKSAIMHDWWYALCASTTGHISFINRPSIKYRQHATNVYGSKGFFNMLFSGKDFYKFIHTKRSNYLNSFKQDLALKARLDNTRSGNNSQYNTLADYCRFNKKPGIARVIKAASLGIHQQGFIRNLFFYSSLLLTRP